MQASILTTWHETSWVSSCCRFIFRLADLDLGRLGMAFALLRMPRMPEIKHAAVALRHFVPSSVDPDSVKVQCLEPFSLFALCYASHRKKHSV